MKNSMNLNILIFDVLLGMIIVLMAKSGRFRSLWKMGGNEDQVEKRAPFWRRQVLVCLFFVDDYFNCLTVGSVMRPVTDRYKVSRAKLCVYHRFDSGSCLYYRADLQLGGCGKFLRAGRCGDQRISAFYEYDPV